MHIAYGSVLVHFLDLAAGCEVQYPGGPLLRRDRGKRILVAGLNTPLPPAGRVNESLSRFVAVSAVEANNGHVGVVVSSSSTRRQSAGGGQLAAARTLTLVIRIA